ncbi:hypothetical protein SAMN05443574_12435 [Haloarcula vallismortis]|uniref:Uncharacterized protein n=2 Tax=Haloarcula vallismortis TaxID=28442 RepID=M0JQJ9_HALVA|nr:hypothetical protein [Haloarcula vallismortis]EMA09930.1 hypothetical protein C437_04715 [Haloarcula vallismortis ATCC 29715]SDX28303.1 hypothetical protein SAMN05443574_12435 [Haloarcula vallismortis]
MNPRKLTHISTFLDNIGKSNDIEAILSNRERFTEKDLKALNEYLSVINFDQDRYAVWGQMLLNGDDMPMITELCLIHHLREVHGQENVDIHKTISGEGSTDFDAVVQLEDTTAWIEITYEDLMKKHGKGPGMYDPKMTGYQIDDKIEKDFQSAKPFTDENDLLVLALYMEAGPMQSISTDYRLREGGKHDIPEFLDGFIKFSWIWDPDFDYIPFTESGASVADDII